MKRGRKGPRQRLIEIHRELRGLARDPEAWARSRTGADLWIDGLTAMRAADRGLFPCYLDAYLDFAEKSGAPLASFDEAGAGMAAAASLERFDPFLRACAQSGPGCFWPALAVGFCLVRALGGPPRLEEREAEVVNDSLLFLVSPAYRALRLAAYNAGVRTISTPGRKAPVFRPEYGCFVLAPPFLVEEEPPRVQFFSVNHDVAHIVLFGDVYLRPVGSPAVTASLLLHAEETACSVDFVVAAEILRFGVELQALADFEGLARQASNVDESGGSAGGSESILREAAGNPASLAAYQAGSRAAAQRLLRTPSPLSERIAASAPVPAGFSCWMPEGVQQVHADWSEKLAARVWDPAFQRLVSLLPADGRQVEALLRHSRDTWKAGGPILDGPVPEPSPSEREAGRLVYHLRFLVIRAAELAARFTREGRGSSELLDELTGWALRVIEDVLEIRKEGASGTGWERAGLHAAAARSLLFRHGAGERELGLLFEAPGSAPSTTGPPSSSEPPW